MRQNSCRCFFVWIERFPESSRRTREPPFPFRCACPMFHGCPFSLSLSYHRRLHFALVWPMVGFVEKSPFPHSRSKNTRSSLAHSHARTHAFPARRRRGDRRASNAPTPRDAPAAFPVPADGSASFLARRARAVQVAAASPLCLGSCSCWGAPPRRSRGCCTLKSAPSTGPPPHCGGPGPPARRSPPSSISAVARERPSSFSKFAREKKSAEWLSSIGRPCGRVGRGC